VPVREFALYRAGDENAFDNRIILETGVARFHCA